MPESIDAVHCVLPEPPKRVVRSDARRFVLSVQQFSSGGFEGVVREVDLAQQAELARLPRRTGERPDPGEEDRDPRNVQRSAWRAKRRVRHSVKEMQADRLLTLTTREQSSTPEAMLERWQRWLRLVERCSVGRFHYVAVLEPHPSNPAHLHIHVAIAVFLPVNLLRQCWWQVCGGRGMGNVHIKRLGGAKQGARVSRVASYISKYLTKDTLVRFNKKRYWSSRVNLVDVKTYLLGGRTLAAAFGHALSTFKCYPGDGSADLWVSPGAGVAWFQNDGSGDSPIFPERRKR